MNPEAIKPAGLPNTDNLATPPSANDPMLAQAPDQPQPLPEPVNKQASEIQKQPKQKTQSNIVKKQSNGTNVGLAIFATVIIVAIIASLAVYAYLKQH
ncbi:MAG TPA: hypothetical protein VLF63_00020 [Patescibacteria group bacterium]|nr:hypothetical protein [Patescibacteria group bacterium]